MRRKAAVAGNLSSRTRSEKPVRLLLTVMLAATALAQPGTVTSVAGARFHAGDLAQAREFYTKVFGLQEKVAGQGIVRFQLNAGQYLEFSAAGSGAPADLLEVVVFG